MFLQVEVRSQSICNSKEGRLSSIMKKLARICEAGLLLSICSPRQDYRLHSSLLLRELNQDPPVVR